MNYYQSGDASTIVHFPKRRSCTNIYFITAFTACFLFMLSYSLYFLSGNDIQRLIYGYDQYGNICGIKNQPIDGINCSGKDMSEQPVALVRYFPVNACLKKSLKKILPFKCVQKCQKPNRLVFHRCYPQGDEALDEKSSYYKLMIEIFHAISKCWTTIFTIVVAALGSTLVFMCGIKYKGVLTIFGVVSTVQLLFSLVTSVLFWNKYFSNTHKSIVYLLFAVIALIYFTFITIYLLIFHNSLPDLNIFYEEATRAIFDMPFLLTKSIVIFLVLLTVTVASQFFITLTLSERFFKDHDIPIDSMEMLRFVLVCYTFFMVLWICSFMEGFQAVTTAGCVIRYYFADNTKIVKAPLKKSLRLVLRYHLGTVSCTSLLLVLSIYIRNLTEFITRKIYIITVLSGKPFEKTCWHLWYLLKSNIFYLTALTGLHFILISGIVLVVILISVGMGIWINLVMENNIFDEHLRFAFGLGVVVASIAAAFLIQPLSVAVDTIFLLSCEEKAKKAQKSESAALRSI